MENLRNLAERNTEYQEHYPLEEKQRHGLRTVLAAIGFSLMPVNTPDEQISTLPTEETTVSFEQENEPSFFQTYIDTVATEKQMSRSEVLFVDSYGQMLTPEPVQLTNAAGYTPQEMTWRYKGGNPVGIPGMWASEYRADLSMLTGVDPSDIQMRHTYLALQKAEFEEIDSLIEVAQKRLSANVEGDLESRTYIEYVDDEFSFEVDSEDSEIIKSELSSLILSLALKESLLNPAAVSGAGARGPLQIMPATWEKYSQDGEEIESFIAALRISGEYFEASYTYLTKNLESELLVIETEFFDGDHEAFVRDFLVPVLVNGYNAGDGNMRDALQWFVYNYDTQDKAKDILNSVDSLSGKDVFFAFSHAARVSEELPAYGEYAGNYVQGIYGWHQAIQGIDSQQPDDIQVASN